MGTNTHHPPDTEVDVYPVGVLDALLRSYRGIRHLGLWGNAYRDIRYTIRGLLHRARRRQWRALRNAFNGYLAEPLDWPDGLKGCGHGWTKKRALRKLHQRMRTGR